MKTPFLILNPLLISILFAETPVVSGRSGTPPVTQNEIDEILNTSDRTNPDFIDTPDRVPLPDIPVSSKVSIPPISGSRNSIDKRQYNLFNPTPDHALRGLSPDRPDATESPITVDAGRYQIEASLFDYRRDRSVETFTYGQFNLKAGLTHNIDLQAVIDVRSETAGDWTTFGDLTLRLKYNLRGNDGGESALAIMPYLTAPTRSDEWEGGIIIPWATDLTEELSLGLQGQFDFIHDGNDHETEFLFTAVLGYPLIGNLGGYTEYIGVIAEDRYESYYSGGLTYEVNKNFVLDAGVQVGLNSSSEDFGLFTGFTKRF